MSEPVATVGSGNENLSKEEPDKSFRIKSGLFLFAVSGFSALLAFGMTLGSVKKRDPKMFDRGVGILPDVKESGVQLATRALKWGTFYAVSGCSIITYGIWKLSGANSMEEFKSKMGSILPKIPKNSDPQGRTEFSGLNDLLQYISTEYKTDSGSSKSP